MQAIHWQTTPPSKKIERLEKKLLHYMGKAIADYKLIKNNDRILVCVSGGKDSITMLLLLKKLQKRAKINFEIFSFTLDQAQPGWQDDNLRNFITSHDIPFEILTRDTYSIVKEKIPEGATYCSLCSRLRRGIIYQYAKKNGFNKVALGHHRDDLISSLLMSIFYNGEIRSMPPKLLSDDLHQILIRPLSYCQEKDIAEYAALNQFPIIPCNLCGSQENLARKKVKRLIEQLALDNPKIPSNMLSALQQIRPSQMMDKDLWDFHHLEDKQVMAIADEI
jgi:tRNA 2-thiocytidine biosynthesis protein TtcA